MHPEDDLWTRAEDYADGVDRRWRGALLVVAAFEAGMAVVNLLVLPAPANVVMAVVQSAAVVALLVMWRLLRERALPHRVAQPVIAFALTVFSLMLPLEMALTGNALLTANLCLVLMLSGSLLVETRWFATTVVVLVAAWAVVLATRGPWEEPTDRLVVLVAVATALAVLVHVIRVGSRARLIAALEQARANALRDDLTGLWNRRGARIAARPVLGQSRSTGHPVWALALDVAGLKAVNDRCGHPAGDRVLLAVGRALARMDGLGAVTVRWGGDEFAVIGAGPVPDVDQIVAEVMSTAEASGGTVDQPWSLHCGITTSLRTDGPDAVDRLVAAADVDLYRRRGPSRDRTEHS